MKSIKIWLIMAFIASFFRCIPINCLSSVFHTIFNTWGVDSTSPWLRIRTQGWGRGTWRCRLRQCGSMSSTIRWYNLFRIRYSFQFVARVRCWWSRYPSEAVQRDKPSQRIAPIDKLIRKLISVEKKSVDHIAAFFKKQGSTQKKSWPSHGSHGKLILWCTVELVITHERR